MIWNANTSPTYLETNLKHKQWISGEVVYGMEIGKIKIPSVDRGIQSKGHFLWSEEENIYNVNRKRWLMATMETNRALVCDAVWAFPICKNVNLLLAGQTNSQRVYFHSILAGHTTENYMKHGLETAKSQTHRSRPPTTRFFIIFRPTRPCSSTDILSFLFCFVFLTYEANEVVFLNKNVQ